MPKPTKGPRLGGSSSHQKALLANLATSLFEHGRIKTTETKARALRPYAEKLITHAKKGTLHNRREVIKKIRDKDVVHTLFAEIGPFYADRNGGYTRIIKVEPRQGRQRSDGGDRAGAGEDGDVGGRPGEARRRVESCCQEGSPSRRGSRAASRGRAGGDGRAWPTRSPSRRSRPKTRRSRRLRGRGRGRGADSRRRGITSCATSPPSHSDGGLVRLRLDIAYDGTEFAGWAVQGAPPHRRRRA